MRSIRKSFINRLRSWGRTREAIAQDQIDPSLLHEFGTWAGSIEPDSVRNFLGVRTRAHYSPGGFPHPGKIETLPGHGEGYDGAEWNGLLRSVLEARDRYVAVELGAGWGPWIVAGAVAARKRGIRDIQLVGVEGAHEHIDWMRQHFVDNDLNPDDHLLIHAAVGPYDGEAQFPKLGDPGTEWGPEAVFASSGRVQSRTPQSRSELVSVPCVSLNTLLAKLPIVDFVHFDIQGAELEVVRTSTEAINTRVRRVVIGVHGDDLADGLRHIFSGLGWSSERDKPCAFRRGVLVRDGMQIWRNRAL